MRLGIPHLVLQLPNRPAPAYRPSSRPGPPHRATRHGGGCPRGLGTAGRLCRPWQASHTVWPSGPSTPTLPHASAGPQYGPAGRSASVGTGGWLPLDALTNRINIGHGEIGPTVQPSRRQTPGQWVVRDRDIPIFQIQLGERSQLRGQRGQPIVEQFQAAQLGEGPQFRRDRSGQQVAAQIQFLQAGEIAQGGSRWTRPGCPSGVSSVPWPWSWGSGANGWTCA